MTLNPSATRTLTPLRRLEAGEGEDPSHSDGNGEGFPSTVLAKSSPGRLRCAPGATLARLEARERSR
jgi:hypothetical protein